MTVTAKSDTDRESVSDSVTCEVAVIVTVTMKSVR